MLLYLLPWYFILLVDFSRGEIYSITSTIEDQSPVTLSDKEGVSTTETINYDSETSENDQQLGYIVTSYNTEDSRDTQETSVTTTSSDFISTTDEEETTCVVPGPILNLTTEHISSDYLNITWLAPSYGSDCVKLYLISWSDTSTTIWTNKTTSELYYTIEDLKPCTTYVVAVLAEGKNGEMSEPRNSTVTTASAVPGSVSKLTLEDITSDSLTISWLAPSYGSNCVNQYIISWSDSSTTIWSSDKTDELRYTIKRLKPCTQYFFTIASEGANGETSQPSISMATTSSVVPGKVSNITIKDTSSHSLNISWLAPSYGGNCVKLYVISWNDGVTDTWSTEKTSDLYYTIENLNPCTKYEISVIAESNTGEISEARNSTGTTDPVVPGPVSGLSIENTISPDSISLSWLAPSYGGSCVNRYIISWSDSYTVIWSNETTSELFYTIEGLNPCTKYVITVVAEGNNGDTSQPSKSSATTASVVPGAVSGLNIENITSPHSISISWMAPSYGGSCVKRYIISWSDSSTTIWSNDTASELFYTIEGLNPCKKYDITVVAQGNNGDTSQPSKSTATTASVVPGAVSDLDIENITSPVSVSLSWLPPSYGGSCVKSYIVSWSDISTAIWSNETTSELFHTIEDLRPCTEYEITVVAQSINDETSQPSKSMATTASVVPGQVSGLSIENITSPDSISISWLAPSYGGSCVKRYIISWSDSSTAIWSNETTSELFHTIGGLNACTTYEITVVAQGNNGDTSQPSKSTATTASVVADLIFNVTIEDIASDYLSISWLETIYGNKCINSYIVFWSESSTTISTNKTTAELYYRIEGLKPCTEYVISVVARGNNNETSQPSTSRMTTASAVPGPVSTLTVGDITSNFLNISWMAPSFAGNCVKSYTIFWREPNTTTWSSGTTAKLYYVIGDLIPCTEYLVSVIAKGANGETSEPNNSTQSTTSVEPDPVSHLTSGFLYPDERNVSVVLNWELPHSLKGILVGFWISYEGYDSQVSNAEVDNYEVFWNDSYWDIDSCCSYVLYKLLPDYDYNVNVSTVIKCDHNESESRYTTFRYPAGVPEANIHSLMNLKPDPFATADPTKQAKLTLYSDFFGEENGRIISYAIIVAQEGYQENPQAQRLNGSKPIMNNWYNATAGEVIWPYQATEENWNPFAGSSIRYALRFDVKQATFTLGTDECTNPGTYCNGELRADTNYSVKIRAFTSGGYQDSQLFYFVTDSEVHIGMILGILFSIISLGAAGIILFMYRNGILNWPPSIFKTPSAVSVPPPSIPIKKFPAHCTQMLEIPNKLSNEYQLLATLSADVYSSNTFLAAQNPENKNKNRYINILPYDSTRVTLEAIDDDPFSDYINASFIKGYSNDIEYIASQGPKEETHVDFWRMILQHNVHLIVMVTNLVENEKVKCYKYYPSLRETFEVRDMTIGCTSEINFPIYSVRTFLLNKGERRRLVTQLHFREWPDFGTPDTCHSMLQFVQTVRDHAARGVGLTVVHCSAGVGRTGTLIALDILLQHICEHKNLDVFGTVFRLRKQRINMVQTEGQYAYIYKCIKEALEDPAILNKNISTTNSLEPIYENVGTSLRNLQYERLSQLEDSCGYPYLALQNGNSKVTIPLRNVAGLIPILIIIDRLE